MIISVTRNNNNVLYLFRGLLCLVRRNEHTCKSKLVKRLESLCYLECVRCIMMPVTAAACHCARRRPCGSKDIVKAVSVLRKEPPETVTLNLIKTSSAFIMTMYSVFSMCICGTRLADSLPKPFHLQELPNARTDT